MHPELTLSLAGHQVALSSIAFFYGLAWVLGLLLATIVAWRRGLPWFWSLFVYACTIVAGIVGARLLHIADNWGYYALHSGSMKALDFDAFALYGGLILAAVVGGWVARSFRLRVWRLADSAVPALALGIALMRLGDFLNGSDFGTATTISWGVTYPEWGKAWGDVLSYQVLSGETGLFDGPKPVHPTQIYEAIAAVVIGLLIAGWLLARYLRQRRSAAKKDAAEGVPFLTFLALLTVFRFGDHFLRAHPGTFKLPEWFYPLLYALIFALAVLLIVWRVRPWKRLRWPQPLSLSRARRR
jgi:prolipoprotein diacylglyceryltransferase